LTERHIVLLGPMGAGKTSLGVGIAQQLAVAFMDSDAALFERYGMTGAEIAASVGVPELHRRELEVTVEALAAPSRHVVAPAASVIDDPDARILLGRHLCLWVEADSPTLASRRVASSHRRALSHEEAEGLNAARRQIALSLIVGQVDTSTSTVEESTAVALRILSDHLTAPLH
jgi:shikimate kinase